MVKKHKERTKHNPQKTNIKKLVDKGSWCWKWCTLFVVGKQLLGRILAQCKPGIASSVLERTEWRRCVTH